MNPTRQIQSFFRPLIFVLICIWSVGSMAAIEITPLEYSFVGRKFEGLIVQDNSATHKRPGILLVHDWLGVTKKTAEQARRLAELGYIVFAVDIYGKGFRPELKDAGKAAALYKKDRVLFRSRMQIGYERLKKLPGVDLEKIVAVGYCFGGTGALELARTGAALRGVVSFHGGLDSPKPADGKRIKAKILALHGADDPFVPAQDVAAFEDELKAAQVNYKLIRYPGAVHSFTDKSAGTDKANGAAYNEKADLQSWEDFKRFMSEIL